MPNINPVDLQTLGARVTDPAQLTEGRWYAVRVNCSGTHNPLVHAQYMGMVGRSLHEFEVCDEDYRSLNRSLGLSKHIHREHMSIHTGKINGGGICEVFKFKQVVESPVAQPTRSPYTRGNCAANGLKEGDKFVLVSDSGSLPKGTIVTLARDDKSLCPYFIVPGFRALQAVYIWRLAPVSPTGRMQASAPAIQNIPKSVGVRPVVANQSNVSAPAATLSPIDQIKSEIDALNAQKQIKQEEIDKLTKDVATIGGEVDKLKQKVADSLKDYLPEPKKPIW